MCLGVDQCQDEFVQITFRKQPVSGTFQVLCEQIPGWELLQTNNLEDGGKYLQITGPYTAPKQSDLNYLIH